MHRFQLRKIEEVLRLRSWRTGGLEDDEDTGSLVRLVPKRFCVVCGMSFNIIGTLLGIKV